ncbi:MAG: 3-phosphoshikimate 1-carboxyvinyltransferase [Bacteroidales bacterium]|nr:3-phosphoshikimate 1-carboxyvinyltransferase [Bacteroidales bacterium]
MTYPDQYPITPFTAAPTAAVTVPGSKSITNRAFVLAALAAGTGTHLTGILRSEDTEVMINALRQLGYEINIDWSAAVAQVRNPTSQLVPASQADLNVANSGTTMRFLTALVALGHGPYRLDGIARMRERPIQDLLDALTQMGVVARSEADNGCPPVRVQGQDTHQRAVTVRATVSSQYLSALLMIAPFRPEGLSLRLDGPRVSEPYIDMTVQMLRHWGGTVTVTPEVYDVAPGLRHLSDYHIEPDASAASYFWAIPAVLGRGAVQVRGLTRQSLQGDVAFVDVLWRMGCRVEESVEGLTVHGTGTLRGVDVDMNAISDTVMTLAAVAVFADGPTTIRNIAHVRHKETDRIAAVATELRKLGAGVEEYPDGLRIIPRPLTGCAVDTYNDHRMAMSLALVGLRVPGVIIHDPGCVVKTYPGFWQDLEKLRV